MKTLMPDYLVKSIPFMLPQNIILSKYIIAKNVKYYFETF